MYARSAGLLGEAVRLWRALTIHSRKQRAQASAALGALRSVAAVARMGRVRSDSAFAYYCKRLAGLVFFHWRALSWSTNWQKPGRLSAEGYDLSDGLLAERLPHNKHARMAAQLVRGAVVHQRRSTLTFQAQDQTTRQQRAAATSGLPSPHRGSGMGRDGSPSRNGSPMVQGTPTKRPKVHALSPTGLSVALVLGSHLVEDADDELELDRPFSTGRLVRQTTYVSSAVAAAPAGGEEEEVEGGEASRRRIRSRGRGVGATLSSEESSSGMMSAMSARTSARLGTTPAGLSRATPSTLGPLRRGDARSAAFVSLEQFAQQERASRSPGGRGGL